LAVTALPPNPRVRVPRPSYSMEGDWVLTLNHPKSLLTNPPGHLWRDKWTTLSGPLLHPAFPRAPNFPNDGSTRRTSMLSFESTIDEFYVPYSFSGTTLIMGPRPPSPRMLFSAHLPQRRGSGYRGTSLIRNCPPH